MEVNEKKDRVTDALNATRAAASEGIVPGGGTALIRCAKLLDDIRVNNDDQMAGVNIIKSALFKPCWTIVANTGIEPAVIVDKVDCGKYVFKSLVMLLNLLNRIFAHSFIKHDDNEMFLQSF